ncbi:hypothetical protein Pgy4_35353, partial [Pseudomonas savastanoi pv. glycinea str. race 4]
ANIDNGRGWKNTFTVLKIAPALIWPNATDRPEPFTGTLTVESAAATEEIDQASSATEEPVSAVGKKIPETVDQSAQKPTPKQASAP